MTQKPHEPIITAIGGGKGGVGKSFVSANLATQYALGGLKVILIDLDVGAANLHTIFGIRNPSKGLGDYFANSRSQINDYLIDTSVANLKLVAGAGYVPELANLKHAQKVKIINQIKGLNADIVLLDLGAGSSLNVVDFFLMTHRGIIVTTPEPTSIVNAYEFIKNVVWRLFFRIFEKHEKIMEMLKLATLANNPLGIKTIEELIAVIDKISPWSAQTVQEIIDELDLFLVLNQCRKLTDVKMGSKMQEIAKKNLSIDLNFSGMVFFNEEVPASVYQMAPISLAYPQSITSQILQRLSKSLLHQMRTVKSSQSTPQKFASQYATILDDAQNDFRNNLLVQKKLSESIQTLYN